MKTENNSDAGSGCPAATCSRLSDVETELRKMADRCRHPAPQAAIVLELAADIVSRNGKDAAEVIRLRNRIRQVIKHRGHVAAEAIMDKWEDEFSPANAKLTLP